MHLQRAKFNAGRFFNFNQNNIKKPKNAKISAKQLKRTGFSPILFLRGLGTYLEDIRKSLRIVRFGW